ncbi:MAG: transglutaminase domain-containing protein [Clostridia bacterium]|nr:transglutaminase domain-containing protein [Clostridia bacterium]
MGKLKTPLVLVAVVAILVVVECRYHLFRAIVFQFSKEKYIGFVADTDYEKMLEKEPPCIKDKTYEGEELKKTKLSAITAEYDMHNELRDKYNLASIATAQNDFDKVLQMLSWLTENTWYNGNQMFLLKDDTRDILEYAFDKPFYKAINCRWKAVALADCLVAVGIKAYPVCMQAADYGACHFTCHAYISELEKWCVFDPSFGCWFSDGENRPVDIFEMREMFLQGEEPTIHGYNFNGTQEAFDAYMNSFLKLCLSNLSTWKDNSMTGRDSRSFSGRKQFDSEIPTE